MEEKKLKIEFEGSDLILKGDLNQDGEPSLELKIKLTELLDEAGYLIMKKKEE